MPGVVGGEVSVHGGVVTAMVGDSAALPAASRARIWNWYAVDAAQPGDGGAGRGGRQHDDAVAEHVIGHRAGVVRRGGPGSVTDVQLRLDAAGVPGAVGGWVSPVGA